MVTSFNDRSMLMPQSITRMGRAGAVAAGRCCYGLGSTESPQVQCCYGIAQDAIVMGACAGGPETRIILDATQASNRQEAFMIPEVRILSDDEVRLLHARALGVLEKVGIKYESRRCLELLEAQGQRVDFDRGIAWIKPDLVERCIASTPRVITLAGRNPQHDMVLEGKRLRITTNGQGTFTQDHRTGERRQGCVKDLRDSTKVGHHLDVVDYVWPMVVPFDVPGEGRVLHEMYHTYAMTSKHIQHEIQLPEHVPFALEMLEVLAGSKDELRRR